MPAPHPTETRRSVFVSRRRRAFAALVAGVIGCGFASVGWHLIAPPTFAADSAASPVAPPIEPNLSQPSWYFTNDDSFGVPARTSRPPAPPAELAQPGFIAPYRSPVPAPPVVPGAASAASDDPVKPLSVVPQISTNTTGWKSLIQQFVGPPAAATPAARPPQPPPGSGPMAPPNLVAASADVPVETRRPAGPATQPATESIPPGQGRFADSLLQQALGVFPNPALAAPQSATSAPNQSARQPNLAKDDQAPAASAPAATSADTAYAGDPVLNKLADIAAAPAQNSEMLAGLWNPLIATNTQPEAAPALPATAAPTPSRPATSRQLVTHSGRNVAANPSQPSAAASAASQLLQPFYQTNTPPAAMDAAQPAAAPGGPPLSVSGPPMTPPSSPISGLFRQLTMTMSEDQRSASTVFNGGMLAEQSLWDGGWTASLPSVANPFLATNAVNGGMANPIGGQAQWAAFLQDAETLPEPTPADLDVRTGENLQPQPAANAPAQGENLAEAERLGEEPEDNSLQFLRTATVLLEPGESQCDVGLTYLLTDNDFPLLLTDGVNIVGVTDARFRARQLAVPIEYRMGLHQRVQGFIGAPVGWSNTQLTFNQEEAFENDGGLGDLNFGLTVQLVDAAVDSPYWIGTLAATAPTGGDPFTGVVGLAPSAPSLGQGFWSINGSLLFVQPYEPLVMFYGLGMERFFPHDYVGREFELGAQYSYVMGVGFAVNERVTLSTRFRGVYAEELKVDGQRVVGTNVEPMTLRFSATISKPCHRIVEPFIEFGLTDDSVSAFCGVTWTFQPGKNKPADNANHAHDKNGP